MTDKEKVLAKWPGAYCCIPSGGKGRLIYDGGVISEYGARFCNLVIGSGQTEAAAWANAAKGLE